VGQRHIKILSDFKTVQLFTMLKVSQYNTIGQLIARKNGRGERVLECTVDANWTHKEKS
jgi:hypothetical protein